MSQVNKQTREPEKIQETPEAYARAIDELPTRLAEFFGEEAKRTGWAFEVIFGGPSAVNKGRIETMGFHQGKNDCGLSFAAAHPTYAKTFLEPFHEFLTGVYPKSVCDARVLGSEPARAASVDSEDDSEPNSNSDLPRDSTSPAIHPSSRITSPFQSQATSPVPFPSASDDNHNIDPVLLLPNHWLRHEPTSDREPASNHEPTPNREPMPSREPTPNHQSAPATEPTSTHKPAPGSDSTPSHDTPARNPTLALPHEPTQSQVTPVPHDSTSLLREPTHLQNRLRRGDAEECGTGSQRAQRKSFP
ncbi:hypothetical protein BD779DRAFT_1677709 [Infundibulicybe gibba]|nr:hypothetical protein BD779DRAFT_1677709 [Infundibulicybe gibba]